MPRRTRTTKTTTIAAGRTTTSPLLCLPSLGWLLVAVMATLAMQAGVVRSDCSDCFRGNCTNSTTGACVCHPLWTGTNCDECDEGYYKNNAVGRDFNDTYLLANVADVSVCVDHCRNLTMEYAAVQAGGDCRCGNEYGKYEAASTTDMCNETCSGGGADPCGGANANSVYSVLESSYSLIGCFNEAVNGPICSLCFDCVHGNCTDVDKGGPCLCDEHYTRESHDANCTISISPHNDIPTFAPTDAPTSLEFTFFVGAWVLVGVAFLAVFVTIVFCLWYNYRADKKLTRGMQQFVGEIELLDQDDE